MRVSIYKESLQGDLVEWATVNSMTVNQAVITLLEMALHNEAQELPDKEYYDKESKIRSH